MHFVLLHKTKPRNVSIVFIPILISKPIIVEIFLIIFTTIFCFFEGVEAWCLVHDGCWEKKVLLKYHPFNEFKYNKFLDLSVTGFAKQKFLGSGLCWYLHQYDFTLIHCTYSCKEYPVSVSDIIAGKRN